jgi:hypothetical protein
MPIHITKGQFPSLIANIEYGTDQIVSSIANKWMDSQYGSERFLEKKQKLNAVKYNSLVGLHGIFTLTGLAAGVAMIVGTVFRAVVPSSVIFFVGAGLLGRLIMKNQIDIFAETDVPEQDYLGNRREGEPNLTALLDTYYYGASPRVGRIFRNCLIPPSISEKMGWEENEISVFGYSLLKNPVPMPRTITGCHF